MRKLFILYFLLPLMAWGQSLLPPCQGSNALHWSFCFGTAFTDLARRDLLEIFDDRHELRSTLVTSQLPVEHWHDNLGDPTLADAILDRLVHNAHRIPLTGESMRKKKSALVAQMTGSTQAADRQR